MREQFLPVPKSVRVKKPSISNIRMLQAERGKKKRKISPCSGSLLPLLTLGVLVKSNREGESFAGHRDAVLDESGVLGREEPENAREMKWFGGSVHPLLLIPPLSGALVAHLGDPLRHGQLVVLLVGEDLSVHLPAIKELMGEQYRIQMGWILSNVALQLS